MTDKPLDPDKMTEERADRFTQPPTGIKVNGKPLAEWLAAQQTG